jgi:hypothetical protein
MKRIVLLLFAGICVCQYVSAQFSFNFGPEIGAGISSLSKSTSTTDLHITTLQNKTNPLIGPLAGIYFQIIAKKTFLFNTALQYEISGQHSTVHEEGYDTQNAASYIFDSKQNQTFNKICMPVSAGITFPLLKIHISIFGGWRGNYFLSGKYYYSSVLNYPSKPRIDQTTTYNYNPLKSVYNIKPFSNQAFFGISFSKKRFEFALNAYIGLDLIYSSNSLLKEAGTEYKNNDFAFIVRYRFYAFKNEKTHCNIFN